MKKILFIVIVVILLVIVNGLAHSIYDIWQKKDYVTQAQNELDLQKQQNSQLKAQLTYAQTPEFIEKEARDKLFMTKQGEQKILLPQDSEKTAQENRNNLPNWQQWWNLFF